MKKIIIPLLALLLSGYISCSCAPRVESSPSTPDPSTGNPSEPSSPTNPNDPQDPVDPNEPQDPVNPNDPVDPNEPQDPVNPNDPVDPNEPQDPVNPNDPVDPNEPQDPVNPNDPVDPNEPQDPVDPNEPEDPSEPLPKKVTINPNYTINKDISYSYSFENVISPELVNKVKIVLDIDFNGAGVNYQYYGGIVTIAGAQYHYGNNGYVADTQEGNVVTNRENTLVYEVSNLSSASSIDVNLKYWGPDNPDSGIDSFDVKVKEFTYYYDNGAAILEETVETEGAVLWREGQTSTQYTLNYSQLTKKGNISKIVLGLETTNSAGYTGGTIYAPGYSFNSSSLINLGNAMLESGTTNGEIVIYPDAGYDLTTQAGSLNLIVYWAPASEILLEYVTFYTEVSSAPEVPSGLTARVGNGSVSLSWENVETAASYLVYCNNEKVAEVNKNYYTVTGLTNGTEYNFDIVAKNNIGSSTKTSISATPIESTSSEPEIPSLPENATLIEYKENALLIISDEFDNCDIDNYSSENWIELLNIIKNAKADINIATTKAEVDVIVSDALEDLESIETVEENLKDCLFTVIDPIYKVEMIDGDTYISWEENPISWETVRNIDKKTGQGTSLEHDFSTQKTFYMNVQNVGENKMFVRLRLANLETISVDESKNYSTKIVTLEPNQEYRLTVTVEEEVDLLYLFVNSTIDGTAYKVEDVAGPGCLKVMDYGFITLDNTDYTVETVVDEVNQVVPAGTKYNYTFNNVTNLSTVDRVKMVVYFDGSALTPKSDGSINHDYDARIEFKDAKIKATKAGYIDEVEENNRTMGYRHSFVFETGTLTTSDTIEFDLREVPAGYVVTIEEVVLYHNSLTNVKEEIVDIEDYVIWTGDGTGSSGTYGNFSLALNELNNSGAIRKIVVGLNSTSNLGWASAKLQFKNLDLCSSGYANISSVVATSGTIDSEVVVYPEKIVYAGPEGATLDINCWWASPDQIKITYVKIYTA